MKASWGEVYQTPHGVDKPTMLARFRVGVDNPG